MKKCSSFCWLKVFLFVPLFVMPVMNACGGGGGGGGLDSRCDNYCKFACAKAMNCGFFGGPVSQEELRRCSDGCVNGLDDASNGEQCLRASEFVAIATCRDLAVFFGFARQQRTDPDAHGSVDGINLGQSAGIFAADL